MTDIVERLRAHKQRNYRQQTKLDWEAADEIERLRTQLQAASNTRDMAVEQRDSLRAALERIATPHPEPNTDYHQDVLRDIAREALKSGE